MFLAPHHVAYECDDRHSLAPWADGRRVRWTWIAGHRFRGIRRL